MMEIITRVMDCHVAFMDEGVPSFLMLKRSADKMYGGIWQCVTGKMEVGEKPFQAALREVKEETSLDIAKLWTVDRVNYFYEAEFDRMNMIPVFGCNVRSQNIVLSDEHCDYRWCTIDKAIELFLWDQQKQGALAFYEMLTQSPKKLSFTEIDF